MFCFEQILKSYTYIAIDGRYKPDCLNVNTFLLHFKLSLNEE